MVAVFGVEIPVIELFLIFSVVSIILLIEIIVVLILLLKHRQKILSNREK